MLVKRRLAVRIRWLGLCGPTGRTGSFEGSSIDLSSKDSQGNDAWVSFGMGRHRDNPISSHRTQSRSTMSRRNLTWPRAIRYHSALEWRLFQNKGTTQRSYHLDTSIHDEVSFPP